LDLALFVPEKRPGATQEDGRDPNCSWHLGALRPLTKKLRRLPQRGVLLLTYFFATRSSWVLFGAVLCGNVLMKCTKFQICSSDSTLAKAGMPLSRIPFFTIQKSSRSEYCCTSAEVRSAARGYIHRPASVGSWPSRPWQAPHSVPKSLSPSSMLAWRFGGAGGILSRLLRRTKMCLAQVARMVSKWPGS